jgi:hypothetical protein
MVVFGFYFNFVLDISKLTVVVIIASKHETRKMY